MFKKPEQYPYPGSPKARTHTQIQHHPVTTHQLHQQQQHQRQQPHQIHQHQPDLHHFTPHTLPPLGVHRQMQVMPPGIPGKQVMSTSHVMGHPHFQQPPQQQIGHHQQVPLQMNGIVSSNGTVSGSVPSRRGPWSPMEDKKLLELITIFGPTNWVRISNNLLTRTPKQCRERYHQNLKPTLNRSPITVEEGELIESLVAKYGKKWAEISRHLNGRSDNAIKNWWNGGANRRRRASLATVSSSENNNESDIKRNNSLSSPTTAVNGFTESKSTMLPPPPTGPISMHSSSTNTANSTAPTSASSTSGVSPSSSEATLTAGTTTTTTTTTTVNEPSNNQHPQLPQISFNTSMFGKSDKNGTRTSPPPPIFAPHSGPNLRSASFDINSTTLPPITQSNKRRLIEDQFNRRHSLANPLLPLPNPSGNIHPNASHPNLLSSYTTVNNPNGNVSPSCYGSPLLLSNNVSRNNSISHFELLNNSTCNSSRRSSSIAPDFFPNPLTKDSTTHKRNLSQNSLFNSPSMVPLTRSSISSNVRSDDRSNSNTSINETVKEDEEDMLPRDEVKQEDKDIQMEEEEETFSTPRAKIKMSVSSLLD